MLEEDPEEYDKNSWKKRQKYSVRCKEAAWRQWNREYLTALHERHNMTHKTKVVKIDIGDVVMIKREDKKERKVEDRRSERTIWRERSRKAKCSNHDSKRVLRATNPIDVPSRTSLQ